jgi:hypothetical protein
MGSTAGNMGVAVGDLNQDGMLDLFVTHLSHEQHSLWMQGPRGYFQDRLVGAGPVQPRWQGTGFGAVMADLDLDGYPDLAWVNGRVLRGEVTAPPLDRLDLFWHPYAQRNQVFLNSGAGSLLDVSESNPAFCGRAGVGRGLVMGDIDDDGDVDLISTCTGGPAQIHRNVAPRRGHWLTVRVLDPALGDRDAIGAEIDVTAGGRRHWAIAQPSSSFLVSHDPRVHLGLGPIATVEGIRVRWPDGLLEVVPGGPADRHLILRRGSGTRVGADQTPPP